MMGLVLRQDCQRHTHYHRPELSDHCTQPTVHHQGPHKALV